MKKFSVSFVFLSVIMLGIFGCGKKPEAELAAAQKALAQAKAAQAEHWAPDMLKLAEQTLSEGQTLIGRKKYKEAGQALLEAVRLADKASEEAAVNLRNAELEKEAERAANEKAESEARNQEEQQNASRNYTVQRGDCLWNIANAQYSDPYKWPQIYQANQSAISNPDLIYPNQILDIP